MLDSRVSGPRRLRELLNGRDTIVVPGAFDCLSAKLIEAAGFPAVYMTGFGTAASYLGRPDVGLLDMTEMVDNARRTSEDFVVIARTDARAVEGLAAALQRARVYRAAGADALFIEAPHSEREVEIIAKTLLDVPLIFNWVDGGRTPRIPLGRIRKLGFRIVLFPVISSPSLAPLM